MNIGVGGLANNADVGSSYVFEDCVFGCSRDICEIAVAAIDGADFKGVSFMDVTVRSSQDQITDNWQGSSAPLGLRCCSFPGLCRLDGDLGCL